MRADRIALFVALAACDAGSSRPPVPEPAPAPAPVARPAAGSTITAADYIGPAACGECHPDRHAQWSASLHAVMNQRAAWRGAVIGDFDGAVVGYAGGEARFARDGGAYTMTLAKAGRTVRYRVTRTIGRRGLQEYVGVEDRGVEGGGDEVRLPFAWWPALRSWFPQPYFDPWFAKERDFDAYAPVREPWAERCPWCHSTYPFEQRIARASARPVGHGLEQAFVAAPGSDRLATEQQVTVGISCESCHLGGRAHADGAAIQFVPEGATPRPGAPAPTTFAAERRDPAIVNRVCAQCHSGPSPRLADGTALRNSSEALDLAASACTTARCIDCHDPHTGGSDDTRAIAACAGCHPAFADPSHGGHGPALPDHAAPPEGGAKVDGHAKATCLDCHMPRMVMGIDHVVRTHRISSPADPQRLAAATPNACNLCHVDRSIAWTVAELRAGWDVRLDPRGWRAYGDLERPVGEVWRTSKEPALRLIAADAYARSPDARGALPALLDGLADPLPHLRAWTQLAVERALGRRLSPAELDVRASPAVRAAQLAKLRATLR